jgi:DNA-binding NtrC family response regulator
MYSYAREELLEVLESGVGLGPDSTAELWKRLAFCNAALGRAEDADHCVEQGLGLAGVSECAIHRLGAVRGYASFVRGDYASAAEHCSVAVAGLRAVGDHEGLSSALRWLGLTHLRTGNMDAALECIYCALAEARQAGLEAEIGFAHAAMSIACIQSAQYDAALRHGRDALGVAERLGHQSGIVRRCLDLSIAARLSGQLDLAASYGMRALASAEEAETSNQVVSGRLAVGRAFREAGRFDEARELTEGALPLAKDGERKRDLVLVLEDLADLDTEAGDTASALAGYRKAWSLAVSIAPEGDLVSELAWRIGASLLELGDQEGAISWIEKGVVLCAKSGEAKDKALTLRARGLWNAARGHLEEARADLDECLTSLEILRVPYEEARTHLAFDCALAACATESTAYRPDRSRHLAAARRLFDRMGAKAGSRLTVEAERRLLDSQGLGLGQAVAPRARGARLLATKWSAPAFLDMLKECDQLGRTTLPVLLMGETGTGKTLVAELLHEVGRGEEGELFPINCAAMPEHLQESELFGHKKGSFTGAEREHPGILREAARGTVFLDEIDKTTLQFQAKLLHVLDSQEIRPVGGTRRIRVEARLICATNRDLYELVEKGEFLEDLYHRLAAGVIQVPALRFRTEDTMLLAGILLEEICRVERMSVPKLSDSAWRLLTRHDWPGNVRELKALLHRTVALNAGKDKVEVDAAELSRCAPAGSPISRRAREGASGAPLSGRLESAEREEILAALEKAGGVRKRAAEILGVSYRGLGKKMARLKIEGVRGRKRAE